MERKKRRQPILGQGGGIYNISKMMFFFEEFFVFFCILCVDTTPELVFMKILHFLTFECLEGKYRLSIMKNVCFS